jgi:hypothetical protein
MNVVTIQNAERTKKVIITRTLLSDGYNYYLMLVNYNEYLKQWFINDNYRQIVEIKSKREAIEKAEDLLHK